MALSFTQEQIDKAKEKLPGELTDALYSFETADAIWTACEKFGIMDKRALQITDYVGYVLMGLVLPQDFRTALEEELKLPKKTAEEITREINRFIFYPVKPALEQLHRMEIEVSAKVVTPGAGEEGETTQEGPSQQKPPQKPSGPDAYQEPIE